MQQALLGLLFCQKGLSFCCFSGNRRDSFVVSVSSDNDRIKCYFLKKWRRMSLSLLCCTLSFLLRKSHIPLEPIGEKLYIQFERSHFISGIMLKPISYAKGSGSHCPDYVIKNHRGGGLSLCFKAISKELGSLSFLIFDTCLFYVCMKIMFSTF